jgi:hypothetical protein
MNSKGAGRHRSLGEAHLYVAVAKADGIVSATERRLAGWQAEKGQQVLDILGINKQVQKTIRADVERLLGDPQYASWSAGQHLDHAVELLGKAKKLGDWGAQLSDDKHEQGLLALAQLDGYTIKESRFLREIERRLSQL